MTSHVQCTVAFVSQQPESNGLISTGARNGAPAYRSKSALPLFICQVMRRHEDGRLTDTSCLVWSSQNGFPRKSSPRHKELPGIRP